MKKIIAFEKAKKKPHLPSFDEIRRFFPFLGQRVAQTTTSPLTVTNSASLVPAIGVAPNIYLNRTNKFPGLQFTSSSLSPRKGDVSPRASATRTALSSTSSFMGHHMKLAMAKAFETLKAAGLIREDANEFSTKCFNTITASQAQEAQQILNAILQQSLDTLRVHTRSSDQHTRFKATAEWQGVCKVVFAATLSHFTDLINEKMGEVLDVCIVTFNRLGGQNDRTVTGSTVTSDGDFNIIWKLKDDVDPHSALQSVLQQFGVSTSQPETRQLSQIKAILTAANVNTDALNGQTHLDPSLIISLLMKTVFRGHAEALAAYIPLETRPAFVVQSYDQVFQNLNTDAGFEFSSKFFSSVADTTSVYGVQKLFYDISNEFTPATQLDVLFLAFRNFCADSVKHSATGEGPKAIGGNDIDIKYWIFRLLDVAANTGQIVGQSGVMETLHAATTTFMSLLNQFQGPENDSSTLTKDMIEVILSATTTSPIEFQNAKQDLMLFIQHIAGPFLDAKVSDLPDIKFQLSKGLSNPFIQIFQDDTIRTLIDSRNPEVAAKGVIFLIQFFSLSIMPELVVQDTQRTTTPSHRRDRSRVNPLHIRTDSISGNTLQAPASPFSVPLSTTPTHRRNPAQSLTFRFNFDSGSAITEEPVTPQQPKRSLYQNPNQAGSIDDLGVDYRTTEPVVPKPRKPVPVFAELPQQQTGTDATTTSRQSAPRVALKPKPVVVTFGATSAQPASTGAIGSKVKSQTGGGFKSNPKD